jgi:hypothetical protein
VEAELRQYPLTEQQRKADRLDFVWIPFHEPSYSSLPVIAGRLAYLLDEAEPELIPSVPLPLDPRLVIPLCAFKASQASIKRLRADLHKELMPYFNVSLREGRESRGRRLERLAPKAPSGNIRRRAVCARLSLYVVLPTVFDVVSFPGQPAKRSCAQI